MTAVDQSPYGSFEPGPFMRAVLAMTRRLPVSWLGLRLSMPLRRVAINALHERPVDTVVWNARMRLYPSRNICEKNALFTPQMFDIIERHALGEAIDKRIAAGGTFTFIDIGANVGLYSLYVASRSGARARILAIEPQPGIVERLRFNVMINASANIAVLPIAVADREGKMALVINERDSGGTWLAKDATTEDGATVTRVICRPLAAILDEAGIFSIDALKIDIEGAEDLALTPFFRTAPTELLPRLVLIEDRPTSWSVNIYSLMQARGYALLARSRQNAIFQLRVTS
jgi:FkbM family methyltransferase